ncbi:Capn15 [Symbiodinium sp. CCMP2592]|nr:Capn15 [Symbiodinium sp. CCMP2592]
MVTRKIKFDLETFVRSAPQFSYIAGRSTEDALRRVFSHCAEGRRLRTSHARNPHQRFAGLKIPAFQGGVQICLDLASAFDMVPHSLVREALLEAGVEAGPASLLLSWLSSCSYDLHLSGLRANIVARRGVKQGCPASPLLFAACTVLLARRIDLRLGSSWVSEHLTMFADDLHLASLFHSVAEFDLECQRLGAAITVLRQHGLIIHPSKAQALLTCTGSQVKQTRQRFVKPLTVPAEGKGLRLRASGEDVLIPLARSADYLGAVISYDCFSAQTLDKRMAQGRTAQVQLRKVLNARKGLLLTQRVLLWRTTVWPCLLYGLGACGLTTAHLASLQTLALKQLRALSNSPAHIHHESDAALCLRLGVPMPREALRRLHDRMLGSITACNPAASHRTSPFGPSESTLDAPEPSEPLAGSALVAPFAAIPTDPPVARAFPCGLCDRSFDTRKSLKLHMARSHQQQTATVVFNRALHAAPAPLLTDQTAAAVISPVHDASAPLAAEVVRQLEKGGAAGLAQRSVLACTATNRALTLFSTFGTAPPFGRLFFLLCIMGLSSEQADQQMEEAFGPILKSLQYKRPAAPDTGAPSRDPKAAKGKDGKGRGQKSDPKGKGKGRGRSILGLQRWFRLATSGGGGRPRSADVSPTIVEQADTIAVLRQSTAWVMWMQTSPPSLVPTLTSTAALWKEKVNDETSELYGLGLRVALIWALLRVLRSTLESPPAELLSEARERKWIDQQGNWLYLRWNRANQALEPDENKQSMNQTDLITLLRQTGTLADGETVSRFAATRQLAESMEGVVTFKVDIQFRSSRAHQLYTNLERLAGLAPLNMLGLSFRKESYKRSNGIQKLAEWWLCWAFVGFHGSLLTRWTNPSDQHDCAELLAHLAERSDQAYLFWAVLEPAALNDEVRLTSGCQPPPTLVGDAHPGSHRQLLDVSADRQGLTDHSTECVATRDSEVEDDAGTSVARPLTPDTALVEPHGDSISSDPSAMPASSSTSHSAHSTSAPGSWCDVWNIDDDEVSHELCFDFGDCPPDPGADASALERIAYDICQADSCSMRQLFDLCLVLPGQTSAKRRRLSTSDGATGRCQRSFSVGAYAAGGTQGIQNNTRDYPWMTRLMTALINGANPRHHYSSCTLLMNVMRNKHRDLANEVGTSNLLLPCSRWRGGQVWVADEQGSVHLDGRSGAGCLRSVQLPYLMLDPRLAHATFPWSCGDRILIVAHHAKGLQALTPADRALLEWAGFHCLIPG